MTPGEEAEIVENEDEFLDLIAPRDEEDPHFALSYNDYVQGCASCGYDPDFCGCGEYNTRLGGDEFNAGL